MGCLDQQVSLIRYVTAPQRIDPLQIKPDSDSEVNHWIEYTLDRLWFFKQPLRQKRVIWMWNPKLRTTFGRVMTRSKNVELSTKLWKIASHEERKEVVVHEMCHWADLQINGFTHHGPEWHAMMILCGYDEPRIAHTLVKRKTKSVKCDCRIHEVGETVFKRIDRDSRRYRCIDCDGFLRVPR